MQLRIETTIWYRFGFRGTDAYVDKSVQVGLNDTQKHKTFCLAPLNENGETQMNQMRTVGEGQDGNPNGYYATPQEARAAVIGHIKDQINGMQQAIAKAEAVELDEVETTTE